MKDAIPSDATVWRCRRAALLLAFTVALETPDALAQQGAITGTVADAETLQPVSGAQVFITGTIIGTLTNAEGRYRLEGVPTGQHTVGVRLIGYKEVTQTVTVAADQVATLDVLVEQTALKLQEIVVTGVLGETPKVKLPFTVESFDADEIPVPAANAAALLAGRAPGVTSTATSGQPGSQDDVILRGPTSINAEGRSQRPLIVIDGIIQSENATLADVGALDIENVEIVKGAAGASLYGSRAQNGVIQITTKRGSNLATSSIDVILRAEIGMSQLIGDSPFPRKHAWLMNEDGTKFIDSFGNEVDYSQFSGTFPDGTATGTPVFVSGSPATSFQEYDYPNPPFDNLAQFYDPGETWSAYGALTGRSEGFSYRVSADRYSETGIVDCGEGCRNDAALENFGPDYRVKDEGYDRWNARLNLDARVGDLDIAASGFYSNSKQDDGAVWAGAFQSLLRFNPFVDLTVHDEQGIPLLFADPLTIGGNPLHNLATSSALNSRARTMGSIDLRLPVNSWLTLEANGSYDATAFSIHRLADRRNEVLEDGRLVESNERDQAVNASFTVSLAETFFDGRLTTRAKARALSEHQTYDRLFIQGNSFNVNDVPTFAALRGSINPENEVREIKARGYFGIVGLDWGGRYILDGLVRRDGSSLFGPEQRWHTYYRGSLAWRPSQEPWWGIDWIDELKLRASLGTAGGRPNFYSRYETYEVSGGGIFPRVLGNTELRPEHSLEREVGLDLVLFDGLAIDLTYAWATTDDQILRVPQPAYTGFVEQWLNAGTIDARTWEASIRWSAIDDADTGLTFRLNLDNTFAEISKLNIPEYYSSGFYHADGEPIGDLWGVKWAGDCGEVAAGAGLFSTDGFDCSVFDLNDDGYMVYVGEGNTYQDGISKELWGTTATVDGAFYEWGMPVQARAQSRSCLRKHPEDAGVGEVCPLQEPIPVGSTQPDLNGAFATSFRHEGFTFSFLMNAALGFDLFNGPRRQGRRVELDQDGKPDGLKKPVQYYERESLAGGLQRRFIEPGGWAKLREVAIGYTLPQSLVGRWFGDAIERLTVTAIGRNLLTLTEYSGFDPEAGFSNSSVGSATIDRWDWYQYPNSRTFSVALEVIF
ncbi:MAG: SusC/RagA family TonB-linked outer membrane protein [Acidobacteriota bacterium]|nr:SusC/RagA family TonB-linked outer membrane protein [Acidobacteriota bacterium]